MNREGSYSIFLHHAVRPDSERGTEVGLTFRRSRQPPAIVFAAAWGGPLVPDSVAAQPPAAAAQRGVRPLLEILPGPALGDHNE